MTPLNSQSLTLDSAQQLLRQFTCLDRGLDTIVPPHDQVRQALLLVVNHSDYQIFGVCADTVDQAAIALSTYLTALGYEEKPDMSTLSGPVYVKYNPKTGRCSVDTYTGSHRGVLVSCQSAYDGAINDTFGHLPLDLFIEA